MVLKKIYAEIDDEVAQDLDRLLNIFALKRKMKSEVCGEAIIAGVIYILEKKYKKTDGELIKKLKKSIGML